MRSKRLIICLLCTLFGAGAALAQPVATDTIMVTGTVIDAADSAALEGALVKVVNQQGPTTTVIDSALTDAQGSYTMTDVPIGNRGNYTVTAELAGYITGTQVIEFPRPDTLAADFALVKQAGPTGDTTLVSGTVVDSLTGNPIQGATVTVDVGMGGGGGGGRDTVGTATTQANGTYQVAVVTQRLQARFIATAAGYFEQSFAGVTLDSGLTVDFSLLPDVVPELIPVSPDPTTNRKPVLAWLSVAGANTYTIQVDTIGDFADPYISTPTGDTSYTPTVDLPIGTIYWRVESDVNPGAYSAVDTFEIQDPDVPVLIAYEPDSTTELRPTLMWYAVNGASAYTIQIDTVGDFASPMLSVPVADTSYTLLVDLPQGNVIYWRVKSDLSATYSQPDDFYIIDMTIVQLIPVSPDPTQDATPTLMWHSVAGADSYRVQIDNRDDFRFAVDIDTTVAGTTFTPAAELAEQTHYWRVQSNISSDWSLVDNFTIVSGDIPLLVTWDGAVVNDLRPTFVWHPVDSATTYTIQIDDAANFNNPIMTVPLADTTYTPLVDLPEAMIYWRVRSDLNTTYSLIDSLEVSLTAIFDRYGTLDSKGTVDVFPNPFQGMLGITVPAGTEARLAIFDMNGQLVRTLTGTERMVWDGTTSNGVMAQPGMYLVKAVIDGNSFVQRVILTR